MRYGNKTYVSLKYISELSVPLRLLSPRPPHLLFILFTLMLFIEVHSDYSETFRNECESQSESIRAQCLRIRGLKLKTAIVCMVFVVSCSLSGPDTARFVLC